MHLAQRLLFLSPGTRDLFAPRALLLLCWGWDAKVALGSTREALSGLT